MAKKKLTRAQKLKKQNKREARQRKKQRAPLIAQKKVVARQKAIEAENKPAVEFCELLVSQMLDDKCFVISKNGDGDLTSADDFIDLMFPYINKLEASTAIKDKAVDMIESRLEKIHRDMLMEYLPDVNEIADTTIRRFNSGERSADLRQFVQKHCDASEYPDWEDSFWDITENKGFSIDDYESLPIS